MSAGYPDPLPQKLAKSPDDELRVKLRARTFRSDVVPPKSVPRFYICGKPVCTVGNLTTIIAPGKTGKTALIVAFIAAVMAAKADRSERDTLRVTSASPKAGARILHLDTEQSPEDWDLVMRTAIRRVGVDNSAECVLSFSLADLSISERRQALSLMMREAGELHAVIIDGIADMVEDPNDLKESNGIVAATHSLAITHNCPIISVIHSNEGEKAGSDARGHLGKQLMRKAESNLRLRKTDEVTVVFSEKMRKAPILESEGPRFKWCDEAGMHVSIQSGGTARDDAKTADLRDLAGDAFGVVSELSYTELRAAVEKVKGCHPTTAERKVQAMKKAGVIRPAGGGKYALSP